MKLTSFTDLALRLLMHLAGRHGDLCTIADVAREHGISEAHLMKVTHLLAQAGLVETLRGRGGGMRLARPAERITLGEVVRLTESDFALVECFTGRTTCKLDGRCALAGTLEDALEAFLAVLDGRTLADVAAPAAAGPSTAPVRFTHRAAPVRATRRTAP